MKRILLPAALAISLCGGFAIAQQPDQQSTAPVERHHHGNRAPDPHKATLRLSKELNLTPDQASKVEPILATRQQKMSALMADTSLTPDARREQFRALHKDSERQIAGVLTPDQLQQLKSMHHGHGRRSQNQPPPAA
jgi:Spy/CpxP family protein refolding chaperone